MIKYTDKGTALQHLTDRLMESALNNVGIKVDADELFRDIAENRLPVWLDELPTYDVADALTENDVLRWCKPRNYALVAKGDFPRLEVRHGRWEEAPTAWQCSVCGCEVPHTYPHCPYCTAKMDKEEE